MSVDQLVQEWEGTGPGPAPGMGKDWGQSKGGKSYQIKQEGQWWQRSQSPERFEGENSELEATFIEREPTPGGYKGASAPGQSKSPSVRRTRRDDFELESSSDERDREYMHVFRLETYVMGMRFPGDKISSTVGSQPVRGEMRHMIIGET